MDFRILGSTEVLDGARRVELPSGRGRAVLALLILHAPEPVAAERIVDELWGEDPPATVGTVVQGLVSRLRTALEPERTRRRPSDVLETTAAGYRLAVDAGSVDANRFTRLVDRARASEPEARSIDLSAALAMWRGPALADFLYEPFAQRAIGALEEMRIGATEDRFDADLALGRGADLIPGLEAMIGAHPFRERLRGQLMRALYRAGRQGEALEAYRRARALLVEELGLEPGPELRELQAAILRHDPALQVRSSSRPSKGPEDGSSSWLPSERRAVAVLAVDIAPESQPAVDPEAVARAGSHAARVVIEVLERHGGRVERTLGDTLVAFFGVPLAHEDDPLRAVRAALEARTAVAALDADPSHVEGVANRMRAGIESGEVVIGGSGATGLDALAGGVIGSAARLQQAAGDGDVIVGPGAARLLRGAVILRPIAPGAADGPRAPAWRVLELVAGAPALPRAFEARMFGRQEELTLLRSAFRRAVRSGAAMRAIVLGDAGIGKSRLAKELAASLGSDADVITLRCPPEDERAFFPLRAALVEAAGLRGWRGLHQLLAGDEQGTPVLGEIAAAIGLRAEPEAAGALCSAMRRLLETLAAVRPLVVIVDDLHWAGEAVLGLVDDLARGTAGPVLLVCLARPEVVERRPGWEQPDVMRLAPLPSADLERLIAERATSITPEALRRIVEVAQGNPLFAEQLLAARDEDPADGVPASLRGLLTMRLDRLGPGERDVLRCASVVGADVAPAALRALLPADALPFVDRHLDTLERKRFIERNATGGFRFGHALIRLAAYQTMTREDRARLHERFAEWLEHQSLDRAPELEEMLGYHLEQADAHRRAIGTRGDGAGR